MRKFWNYVSECLSEIGRGSRIVLIGDINGRVENSNGVNENDEYLVRKGDCS